MPSYPVRRNAPATVRDLFQIAMEALQESEDLKDVDKRRSKKRYAEAKAIFKEARKLDDSGAVEHSWRPARVPGPLRQFVSFTTTRVRLEVGLEIGEKIAADDVRPSDIEGHKAFEIHLGGREEWEVVRDDDAAREIAIERVLQDLRYEPEIFNRDFLLRHIDEEKFKDTVRKMVLEDDYWDEIAKDEPGRFWEEAQRRGLAVPDEDDDGNLPDEVGDSFIDAMKEDAAEDQARDPMGYITDMLGNEEAIVWVLDNIGIDESAAAEAAVNEDGAGHFLSSYDGELHETPSGFCYWRTN